MIDTMRAVVIDRYGDNSVLTLADVERPRPGRGQVLVKVEAAGVNPVDWKIRGGAGARMGLTLPIRLGSEISGTVHELGAGVDTFNAGDAVYGIVDCGGFADYVLAPAADLAHKPANLDFIAAAAIPLGALTAWQAMFDLGRLTAGQRIFITNGSGGVGSMAVQLAKAAGAHVTAMSSTRNGAFLRSLGADAVIDYTAGPFEAAVSEMDIVFDTVGGETFKRAFATVKSGGVMVTSVAFPRDEAGRYGVTVERVQCKANATQLTAIRELVEAGKLAAHTATVLPLADIGAALTLSEAGHTRGKIVLRVRA